MGKSTWLAAARSGSIPSRIAAVGAASVAAAVTMAPMAHAGTPTPKGASDTGTTPESGTGAGASSRKLAARPLDDAGTPDYGTQKVRVGVQRADGSTFPAGSTLVGATIQAVQTGPEEGADGTVTCTVTDDPLYPAQSEGSDQSGDQAPTQDLNPIADCAFPDGYTAFGSYYIGAGNSVTFTETTPPDGPGMLGDEQTYTVGPCVLPDGTPDASGLPDCGAIPPIELAPAAQPNARTRAAASPMIVPPGLPFFAPPVVFVVRPAAVLVPPVSANDKAATTAGSAVTIPVLANDDARGGGALTISTVGAPAHGSAVMVGSGVKYTPAAGFVGTDTFTYTAATPAGSSTATVTVTVAAVPAVVVPPPLAVDDTATTAAGTTVAVPVLANDDARGGGALTISAVTAPAHGTAVVTGSGLSYTPAAGFAGTDAFSYTITTPYGSSAARVTVTVTVPTPSSTAPSTTAPSSTAPKSPGRSTPAPSVSVPPAPSHGVLAHSASRAPSPAPTPLAATGVHTDSYLGTGAGLVVAGGLLTFAGRRRRRTH